MNAGRRSIASRMLGRDTRRRSVGRLGPPTLRRRAGAGRGRGAASRRDGCDRRRRRRATHPPALVATLRADAAEPGRERGADRSARARIPRAGAFTTTAPTRRPPRRTNQTPRSSGASISSAVTERRDPPALSSDSAPAGRWTGPPGSAAIGVPTSPDGRAEAQREHVGEPGHERRAHGKLRRRGIETRADEHVARARDDPRLAARRGERVRRQRRRARTSSIALGRRRRRRAGRRGRWPATAIERAEAPGNAEALELAVRGAEPHRVGGRHDERGERAGDVGGRDANPTPRRPWWRDRRRRAC